MTIRPHLKKNAEPLPTLTSGVKSSTLNLMKINKDKLYKLYMDKVEAITEECDWVTHFGPKDIVGIISNILEQNPELITNETTENN